MTKQKRKYTKRGQEEQLTKQKYRRREKMEEELHPKICPGCNRVLSQEHWNTCVDILTCDNPNCSKYRQPVGNVPILKTTMDQLIKETQDERRLKDNGN